MLYSGDYDDYLLPSHCPGGHDGEWDTATWPYHLASYLGETPWKDGSGNWFSSAMKCPQGAHNMNMGGQPMPYHGQPRGLYGLNLMLGGSWNDDGSNKEAYWNAWQAFKISRISNTNCISFYDCDYSCGAYFGNTATPQGIGNMAHGGARTSQYDQLPFSAITNCALVDGSAKGVRSRDLTGWDGKFWLPIPRD